MISTYLKGRLGNQIFQYAVCRIVAHRKNLSFHIPRIGEPSTEGVHIKNFFENLDLGVETEIVKHHFHDDIYSQNYKHEIFQISEFTKLDGFFQCPKYFEGYEETVRSWFHLTPNQESQEISLKYNVDDYCYIHLRGSDYKWHSHWYLEREYYQKSMEYMKKMYPNMNFVIVTDDVNDAKSQFPEIDCVSSVDMKTDFLILLNSKFTIISNSTFSWWAGWLNKKELVIAPNFWLNYNKPELGFYPKDIKTKEFIYI